MGLLVEGQWVDRWYKPDGDGRFVRPDAVFRQRVTDDGSTPFAPEAGRYHLYVSLACPWAHRTLIARRLRGLEHAIGLTIVQAKMGAEGWEIAGDGVRPVHRRRLRREVRVVGAWKAPQVLTPLA